MLSFIYLIVLIRIMNIILSFLLFIGLGIQAWYDWKHKEIPDLVTATMWFVVMVTPFSEFTYYGMFAFMLAFFTNSLIVHITGKQYLGWGDILILPIYAMMCVALGGYAWFAGVVGVFLAFYDSYTKKERLALVPYMFMCYTLAFVLTVV